MMAKWHHGGDIESYFLEYPERKDVEVLDFSANISPLGMPSAVREALISGLSCVERYPDPYVRRLGRALGEYHQMGAEFFLCGNGASDLIYRLALGLRPKKALLLAPTFSEYEESLSLVSCEIVYHVLQEEQGFALGEDYLATLDAFSQLSQESTQESRQESRQESTQESSLDFCVLCQPNNPTGQVCEKDLLLRIVRKTKEMGVFLLIDECFSDFLQEESRYSLMDCVLDYPHVMILKAFTKMYALAGLRLGYGVCGDVALLDRLRSCGQPWAVSSLAEMGGISALAQRDYVVQVRELIERERVFLSQGLGALGYVVYPSLVNYILFYSENKSLHLLSRAEGVLIRHCGNYVGLGEGYYRVAVGSREANLRLLEVLGNISSA